MGIDELKAAWVEYEPQMAADNDEWDQRRLVAIGPHLDAMRSFLDRQIDISEFRGRIDSLSKTEPLWGFRGTSQMFFNQLVKGADREAIEAALREVLPAPGDAADALAKLERFAAAVEAAREHAQTIDATQPGLGRIDAFVSFFWELQQREEWPTFFPNSRDVLEQHGLLDVGQPQPELYLAYRAIMHQLREEIGADTWAVEHLLWHLGKGGPKAEEPEASPEPAAPTDSPSADLYAGYRRRGLHFPDEVVTSLILSLATKRFVILSGISGTGKTKIATGLAEFLEETNDRPTSAGPTEAPRPDAENHYLRLTAPKISRGAISLPSEARAFFATTVGLPDRGESQFYETRLPDGTEFRMRLNNVDFAAPERDLFRLYFRKEITEWVDANARPGDFLHLRARPAAGVDFELDIVAGQASPDEESPKLHEVIAVRSDWTDPRGLIGYFNPLTERYAPTALVQLLLRAGEDPDRPYLVILDEMNLARVEYYFSDFLSALESGEPLTLMSPAAAESAVDQGDDEVEVPDQLAIPPNVSFLGTVNVDETTHAFSPKVLDRANVIEFGEVDIERALGHGDAAPARGMRLAGGTLDPLWLCTGKEEALAAKSIAHEVEEFTTALEDVHGILTLSNLQFGYRVIDEVSAFVGHALDKSDGEAEEIVRIAFDLQLRQKVIPKLSGGRELEEPLARLLHYCLDGERATATQLEAVRAAALERLDPQSASPPRYPGSARKLLRMLDRLGDVGFVGALE